MNLINVIVVLIMVGGPILGRVIEQGNKKRKARQEQKDAEAQRLEALRTGRITAETPLPPPTRAPQTRSRTPVTVSTQSQPTATARNATQRMQELAKKRQQQLEELRRRQQTAQQRAAGGAGPTSQTPSPAPPRAQQRPTRQPPQQPQTAQRQRKQGTARKQQKPNVRPQETPRPRVLGAALTSHPSTSHSALHELAIDDHVLHPATEAPPSAAQPIALLGKRMTPADWRRFIVARELLDPPLALREQDGGLPH